jgi:hypothetical protein
MRSTLTIAPTTGFRLGTAVDGEGELPGRSAFMKTSGVEERLNSLFSLTVKYYHLQPLARK